MNLEEDNQYDTQRAIATSEVAKALRDGRLIKSAKCELCDEIGSALMGHHWNGYDAPNALNVWWICRGDNTILKGRKYHDGSVSKDEARAIIEASRKARQDKANQPRIKPVKLKDYRIAFEIGRRKYEVIVTEAQNQKVAIDAAEEFVKVETGGQRPRLLWSMRYHPQP